MGFREFTGKGPVEGAAVNFGYFLRIFMDIHWF